MSVLSRSLSGAFRQTPLPLLHIVLWGLALAVMVVLLLGTPTLNSDDLAYVDQVPEALKQTSLPRLLLTVLLNADIGVNELRSYGLARATQILTVTLFGRDPAAAYAFMVLLHAASGFIICFLMRRLTGDTLVAIFATFAWVASPAILPLLKVQHHFLYLIVPYYPLLAWLAFELAGYRSALLRICLLSATWMLGEGAIIPMIAGVTAMAWHRRDVRLVRDGGVAFALLALYMAYQIIFINNVDRPQRFHWFGHGWDIGDIWNLFGSQLIQNGKAILGLGYWDAEIRRHVTGIDATVNPSALVLGLALAAMAYVSSRKAVISSEHKEREGTVTFIVMCALSLALYFFVTVFGNTGFAVRYTAAFYALAPLAIIAAVAFWARPMSARYVAGGIAALCMALSIGLLDHAETLVNGPNRVLLASLPHDTAVLVQHQGWTADREGRVSNDYPGLVSTAAYALPDPKRSAWTLNYMLQLYGGIALGTACRILPDGRIAMSFQGAPRGVFKAESIAAFGLPDDQSITPQRISVWDVCSSAVP